MKRRLLIIGLDGATFDLIDPWSTRGELPNITALMKRGLRADLESTLPPVTFPAWSSFMTGKNPGKHGIYDFVRRRPHSYDLEFVGARSRRGPTLWRLLSDAGLRVGVMALPTTYPPESINGFMISGFDTPVSTGTDPSFIYPRPLFAEIKEQVGQYKITDFQQFRVGKGWHAKALSKIHETLEQKTAIAAYLLQKEPWDCFAVLFGESDTVCHHFWMFHDPRSPRRSEGEGSEFSDAILSVYRRLDAAIGQLAILAGSETSVLLLSDHGFGGTGNKIVYLNRWLETEGFLKFQGGMRSGTRGASALRWAGLNLLPLKLQERLFQRGTGIANRLLSRTQLGAIDWTRTRAFSTEMNTLPAIWINLKGREPEGTVSPGRDYQGAREEIIAALANLKDPETGQRIVARAHRREELYHGPFLERAPDLILELNLDRGYAYTCLSSLGGRGRQPVAALSKRQKRGAKGQSMNGSHRRTGVLLYSNGMGLGESRLPARSIVDLAPTILQFFELPVPDDMDGQAIPEIASGHPAQGVLDATRPTS